MTEPEMMALADYDAAARQPMHDRPRLELAAVIRSSWPERADDIRSEVLDHRLRLTPPHRGLPLQHSLALGRKLKGKLKPNFDVPVKQFGYRRGLVEFLDLTAESLFAHDRAILRCVPVTCLKVYDCGIEELRRLAQVPELRQLIALGVHALGVGDAGIAPFLDSPYLGSLKHLSIYDARLTMAGYERFAEATTTTLAGLEVGYLSGNTIDDPQEMTPSYDGISGAAVHETVGVLPTAGRVLEENLGYQKWLHWCSRFGAEYSHARFLRPLDMDETPISVEEVLGPNA
jgi:hypothetical protein